MSCRSSLLSTSVTAYEVSSRMLVRSLYAYMFFMSVVRVLFEGLKPTNLTKGNMYSMLPVSTVSTYLISSAGMKSSGVSIFWSASSVVLCPKHPRASRERETGA